MWTCIIFYASVSYIFLFIRCLSLHYLKSTFILLLTCIVIYLIWIKYVTFQKYKLNCQSNILFSLSFRTFDFAIIKFLLNFFVSFTAIENSVENKYCKIWKASSFLTVLRSCYLLLKYEVTASCLPLYKLLKGKVRNIKIFKSLFEQKSFKSGGTKPEVLRSPHRQDSAEKR